MPALPARTRYGPAIAAGILITSVLLPPVAAYARQYAYAQALQFLIFVVAGPALLVLGIPWRSRPPAWRPGRGGRSHRPGGRAAIRLVVFIAVVISWRLPVTVNALARNPALVAAEMVTLLAAGTGVWLELVSTPTAPRSAIPPGTRRHGRGGHVDDLGTRLSHRHVRGYLVRRLSPRRARQPECRRGPAARRGDLVGSPRAVLPARHLPHGHRLAGRRSAGNERPAASSSTPAGWPRPPRGWRSPHSRP